MAQASPNMIGSYPRFHKKGEAGPPIPAPQRSTRASLSLPPMLLRTNLLEKSARKALRTQRGIPHPIITRVTHRMPRRSNALLWSAKTTAGMSAIVGSCCFWQKVRHASAAGPKAWCHSCVGIGMLEEGDDARCWYAARMLGPHVPPFVAACASQK